MDQIEACKHGSDPAICDACGYEFGLDGAKALTLLEEIRSHGFVISEELKKEMNTLLDK